MFLCMCSHKHTHRCSGVKRRYFQLEFYQKNVLGEEEQQTVRKGRFFIDRSGCVLEYRARLKANTAVL